MDEFKLIDNFFKKLSGKNSLKLEDDVALLESDTKLAFSTDIIVEDVHFFRNSSAKIIAYKLLESALSDLAAKALCPCYYSLNLSLPKDISSDWFELFSSSLSEIQKKHNIYLLGGDLTNCDKMVLSVTVFGSYEKKIIARNNLQEDDLIYVSGYIGDSYLGLEYLRGNLTNNLYKKYFIDKYNFPEARTDLRNILANILKTKSKKVLVKDLLPSLILKLLSMISWKKSMKWSDHDLSWGRPLRSIFLLFNNIGICIS